MPEPLLQISMLLSNGIRVRLRLDSAVACDDATVHDIGTIRWIASLDGRQAITDV